MKSRYENRTRYFLPRRTYTIVRVDGKAFHHFTRDLLKPWDPRLNASMWAAAERLCQEAQGACLGYVQSDEISVLLQDFQQPMTEAWFDGNIQKIASVSASIVTAAFNAVSTIGRSAHFDARVFTIPDPVEVENYFIWRQKDAERNSLSAFARTVYSDTELHGKSMSAIHEMLHMKGLNWNDLPSAQKRGVVIEHDGAGWTRNVGIPIFTSPSGREWLKHHIPPLWL